MELLLSLVEAVAGAHTRRSLARAAADALGQRLELAELELGWCEPSLTSADAVRVTCAEAGPRVQELRRGTLAASARRALLAGEPQLEERVLTLPLLGGAGPVGYARLEGRAGLGLAAEEARALGRVLRAAQRHVRTIERVAAASRRGHASLAARPREPAIARSPAMRTALERLEAVAPHDTTLLLLGPSGAGKSRLARWVHERSARAQGPLVTLDCGALPAGLVESELFGHARGAFTGAAREHRGRFERAHGGTILLDEVAELSPAAQVRLLRVLQEGELEPLGSERTVRVDVRVIAATHRSLEELVAQGAFREDLYYRLGVFPVRVPGLAERREDMPELVQELAREVGARQGRPELRVGGAALARLCAQPWPGNVRQLANALERAAILSRGDELELAPGALEDGAPAPTRAEVEALPFAEASRRAIAAALRAAGGKLYGPGGAAELLALKPSTLQTKMRKLGLRRRDFAAEV
ncbi:MAG: sigma 54-interacting transcriptional regulator [Planctomycetota bacterium]